METLRLGWNVLISELGEFCDLTIRETSRGTQEVEIEEIETGQRVIRRFRNWSRAKKWGYGEWARCEKSGTVRQDAGAR